jgi:hypothetical protein
MKVKGTDFSKPSGQRVVYGFTGMSHVYTPPTLDEYVNLSAEVASVRQAVILLQKSAATTRILAERTSRPPLFSL